MSITNAVALDCEMVLGINGKNLPAQVTIVNEYGDPVYNTFVFQNNVADYRTKITGLTRAKLLRGRPFKEVKARVAEIIKGRLLVGHSVHHDLTSLGLCHPEWNKRDTAFYFQTNHQLPSLKYLANRYLRLSIQNGAHDALEDARACMRLYKKYQREWEDSLISSESESESDYDDYDDGYHKEDYCIF